MKFDIFFLKEQLESLAQLLGLTQGDWVMDSLQNPKWESLYAGNNYLLNPSYRYSALEEPAEVGLIRRFSAPEKRPLRIMELMSGEAWQLSRLLCEWPDALAYALDNSAHFKQIRGINYIPDDITDPKELWPSCDVYFVSLEVPSFHNLGLSAFKKALKNVYDRMPLGSILIFNHVFSRVTDLTVGRRLFLSEEALADRDWEEGLGVKLFSPGNKPHEELVADLILGVDKSGNPDVRFLGPHANTIHSLDTISDLEPVVIPNVRGIHGHTFVITKK